MKTFLFFTLAFSINFVQSQNIVTTVDFFNWDNSEVFQRSPMPNIKEYGPKSDSISNALDVKEVLFFNGKYYPIKSWADYYRWFVRRYSHLYFFPDLYEFYYLSGDNLGMVSYIAGDYYQGLYYPSNILVSFGDKGSEFVNRLAYRTLVVPERRAQVIERTIKRPPNPDSIPTELTMGSEKSNARQGASQSRNIRQAQRENTTAAFTKATSSQE